MADINTVLKAWECCDPFNRRCFECPYEDDCFHDNFDRVAIADMVKLLKKQQEISVDAFQQWCIESHRMGDATREGIEYWINEFKAWK